MSSGGSMTSLEEFFLSHEFGDGDASLCPHWLDDVWAVAARYRTDRAPSTLLERLFLSPGFGQVGEEPDEDRPAMQNPLATVLAFAPQTPKARRRAVAAVGSVAAAALVVVGLTSGLVSPPGPQGQGQQALAPSSGQGANGRSPGDASTPEGSGASTGGTGSDVLAADGARGASRNTGAVANNVHGSFSVFEGASQNTAASPAGAGASSGAGGGATGSQPLPQPNVPNPATVLQPLTQLTNTVSTDVSTTTQQIGTEVPAAMPITGVVNNVGTAVNGLPATLATPND